MLVSLGEVIDGRGDNGVSYIISIEKKEKMRKGEEKKKKKSVVSVFQLDKEC